MRFSDCLIKFQQNSTLQHQYQYIGSTPRFRDDSLFITKHGCNVVCGTRTDLHDWNESSQAITTWVLPMLVMLLSAPFVSNQFRNSLMAVVRWFGSPVICLAHVLWNLEMSSKCCRLVDMSFGYDEYPEQASEFGRLRDSMYLLSLLNQYRSEDIGHEDRRLLRIALFSDVASPDNGQDLSTMRAATASVIRDSRSRGVVPALISSFWFLFGVAITIQAGTIIHPSTK